jgi:hypothetical protein
MCFGISLSQRFEQNAVVCGPLACVCSITTPDISLSRHFEENAVVCGPLACVCSITTPDISLSQQYQQNAVVCGPLACVCSITTPDISLSQQFEQNAVVCSPLACLQHHNARHQLKPAVRTKRRGLWSFGVCLQHHNARHQLKTPWSVVLWRVCSITTPDISLSQQFEQNARHIVKQIQDLKLEVFTLSVIFTRFGTQRFSPLPARKRRSTWKKLQIG